MHECEFLTQSWWDPSFSLKKALDSDRTILQKMKKAAKAKNISGQGNMK